MTDFERIYKILSNSDTDFGTEYNEKGLPEYIEIWSYGNDRLFLDFYSDGKFMGISIEDNEGD